MEKIARYSLYVAFVLSLIVIGQACALRKLGQFSDMISRQSDDYFNQLVECTNKLEGKK